MEGTYDVCMGVEKMGRVTVSRQGLYYSFFCRCQQNTQQMLWLYLKGTEGLQKLGLLVPENGCLVLKTSLPAKRAGQGPFEFQLRPKHTQMSRQFVPLSPQEPFAYLQRLENAFLECQRGQIGIVLQEQKNVK